MSAVNTLTDGTGVSAFTGSKLVKDVVADFLLSVPAVLIGLQVTDLNAALAMPTVVAIAVMDVGIRVGYRAILRWATS